MFEPLDGLVADVRVTIASRELTSLSREKTIVLALLIQLFIAAFSSFLVVGLTSLYDPGATEGEIEVGVSGEQEAKLVAVLEAAESVDVTVYDGSADAVNAFDNNEINAVLTAGMEPTEEGERLAVDAIVPAESLETTLIIVTLRDVLSDLERAERMDRGAYLSFEPVDLPDNTPAGTDDFTQYFTFTYTILIPLLLFLPAFISGSVVVDSVTEELERGTLELLRVTPASLAEIVDGKAFAMILLAPLQAILWIGLLRFNDIAIAHVSVLLLFVVAITTITTAIGLLLGLLLGTRRQAQLFYSILVLLLFGVAVALPEHPATTIALLSVDSATFQTFAHVAGFTAVATVLYGVVRRYVASLDPESL